jgi:F-type H+-transporting ATPase subunit b
MKQLGIEPSLLLAQIVNFSIIIFVLSKLLFKPILAMLAKRKQEIEAGLALTEKMRADEEKMKTREEKYLEAARKDAKMLLEKAKKDAAETEKQIVDQAHEEAGVILSKAKAETERIRTDMMKEVGREAIDLAVVMTQRITSGILTDADQHKLIARQLKELKTVQ